MQKARKSCSEWGSKRSKKDNYVLEQQTKKKKYQIKVSPFCLRQVNATPATARKIKI